MFRFSRSCPEFKCEGGFTVTLNEIRSAILDLSEADQKKLITEVVPLLWPKACLDDFCVSKFRELVDEATVREYREQQVGLL
jgi:hypothetical protein